MTTRVGRYTTGVYSARNGRVSAGPPRAPKICTSLGAVPGASERIPSPLQALLIWLTAAFGIVGAGLAVASAAAASVVARGQDPVAVLGDPKTSPLTNSTAWIAGGTFVNEIAVLLTVVVWLWLLKTPLGLALPLGRPSVLGAVGAVLLVFGVAPVAEVMGELVHRMTGHEYTASRIVVNAARNASGAGVVGLVVALGVMPALAEEALFRGLITLPFARRFAWGLVVPSVLFGLFHLEPTQIAGTMVLGVAFAAGRLCTGTLVTSMIAHGVYNTTVVLSVRYTNALADRELNVVPVAIGLAVALVGGVLLWRERRMLFARAGGGRDAMPSWWI